MTSDPVLFILLALLLGQLGIAISAGFTAKSKGRSQVGYTLLGLISPLIVGMVSILVSPKTQTSAMGLDQARVARTKIVSIVMAISGVMVQVWAIAELPISDKMTDQEIFDAIGTQRSLGGLTVALAGVLLVVAAVLNARLKPATVEGL